jgi:uncharacterized membrane protein YgaE (UPF0421/DUF939 family)
LKRYQFVGGRVVKTGVAIFLTAWLCELLNWPPVFAVITAIVTLEPTVSDSIKKGIVRFPASAIGSAYAVFFIALFGNSALTYTLAAVFTIATCSKLRLHAGLLVATLTSVAMVEVIHEHFFVSFLIRLGTTTIGLVVSTLVNMFILPPNYQKEIIENIEGIAKKTGKTMEKIFASLFGKLNEKQVSSSMKKLTREIDKTEKLIKFQKEESKFHPLVGSEKESFRKAEEKMANLKLIHYHMTNLQNLTTEEFDLTPEQDKQIKEAVHVFSQHFMHPSRYEASEHQNQVRHLRDLFWEENRSVGKTATYSTAFPPDLIILYELLSIYHLKEAFHQAGVDIENADAKMARIE